MTLTAADVAEIMRLVEQSGFDELNLEIDGTKISLRRGTATDTAVPARPQAPAPAAEASLPKAALAKTPPTAADANVQDCPAPLLGTFYRAPKPGAPPFVEVGAAVEADTIVGIIEVMKLMNTVRAGVRGTVTEVLAADGALVEFGEILLRVRKS
jgi:acetyl-CoA carboxylase biotin carboxyl carrier protein